jgi:O-antigen/teichoic acid export membrane protein
MAEEAKKKKRGDVFSAGTTDEEKKKRFNAGGIIAMAGFLAGGVFQAMWMAVTPRLLGEQGMGLFSPLFQALYAVATLIALGIPQTIVTFVSKHYENEFDESLKFMTDGCRLMFVAAIVTVGAAVLVSTVATALGAMSKFAASMIIVFAITIAFMALFWGVNGILNGFQRLDLMTIGNIVYPIGIFAASTALIVVAHRTMPGADRWDVAGAVAGVGIGHLIALGVALAVVAKTGLVPVKKLFAFKSAHGLYGRILKFGGITAVAFFSMTLAQNLTTIIVRVVGMNGLPFQGMRGPLFCSTRDFAYETAAKSCEAAIGHFGNALIYGLAPMLITGIAVAVIPAMSEAEDRGRRDLMQHYYTSAMSQSMAIIGCFIALFGVIIGPLIEIMNGKEFPAEVMHPLGVLGVIGGSGLALLFVLINMFTGLKRPQIPAVILLAVVVTMTVSITALSYTRNILWPMAGFIAPVWIGCAVCFVMAVKVFGLKFPWSAFFEPAAAAIVPVALVMFALPPVMPVAGREWATGLATVAVLGPYWLVILLFEKRRKMKAPPTGADDLLKESVG